MLAVVGSGEYLAPMASVDRQLLELFGASAKVVCLPTAAGSEGDAMIDDCMRRGVDHFDALGAQAEPVRVWDRSSANDPSLASQIADADVVYLSGGRPGYLYDVVQGTSAWQSIIDVIDRGGLLIGCSAGAMIQGEVFAGVPRRRAGFGLWPGISVVPHFDEIPSPVVKALRLAMGRGHTVVGVDANTALVDTGDGHRVIGQRVTIS